MKKSTEAATHGAMTDYVHGYTKRETLRLSDQADTLATLLHRGTTYPAGSRVLEAGCGTGAQSVHLTANSPDALAKGLVTPAAWQAGMDALNRATAPDGVFGYTFFKATAIV